MNRQLPTGTNARMRPSLVAAAEVVLCLVPVTAGWAFGVVAAVGVAISKAQHSGDAILLPLAILAGLACAAFGLGALWSLLLPQALGRGYRAAPREWQSVGLAFGFLPGSVGLVLVLAGTLGRPPASLLWAYLFASPIVVAGHVVWRLAIGGSSNQEPS